MGAVLPTGAGKQSALPACLAVSVGVRQRLYHGGLQHATRVSPIDRHGARCFRIQQPSARANLLALAMVPVRLLDGARALWYSPCPRRRVGRTLALHAGVAGRCTRDRRTWMGDRHAPALLVPPRAARLAPSDRNR